MRLVLYRGLGGKVRWRLVAANGRKIANGGQGYATKHGAKEGAALALGGRFSPDKPLFIRYHTDARISDAVGVESIPVEDIVRGNA